jgi:hypothetical protein
MGSRHTTEKDHSGSRYLVTSIRHANPAYECQCLTSTVQYSYRYQYHSRRFFLSASARGRALASCWADVEDIQARRYNSPRTTCRLQLLWRERERERERQQSRETLKQTTQRAHQYDNSDGCAQSTASEPRHDRAEPFPLPALRGSKTPRLKDSEKGREGGVSEWFRAGTKMHEVTWARYYYFISQKMPRRRGLVPQACVWSSTQRDGEPGGSRHGRPLNKTGSRAYYSYKYYYPRASAQDSYRRYLMNAAKHRQMECIHGKPRYGVPCIAFSS